jgi:hypothetical protein
VGRPDLLDERVDGRVAGGAQRTAYVTSTGPVFSYRTPTLRSSPCSSRADSRTLSRLSALYFSLSPSFRSSSAVDDMRAPMSM